MFTAVTVRDTMNNAAISGFASGKLRGYSGSVPANADAALGGATQLFECTMNATAFPSSSSGVLTANAITGDASADATGTLAFVRIYASDGTTQKVQLTVGVGSGDFQALTLAIVATQPINVTALTLTLGA